jgi:hypothetical protein
MVLISKQEKYLVLEAKRFLTMNKQLMIARFFVVLAISFSFVSFFTPWFSMTTEFYGNNLPVGAPTKTYGEAGLYDLKSESEEAWVGWVKATNILTVFFATFAMLASFWSVSHPYMLPLLAAVGTVFGIICFSVYMNKAYFTVEREPVTFYLGNGVYVKQTPDQYMTGFIMHVCATVALFLVPIIMYSREKRVVETTLN